MKMEVSLAMGKKALAAAAVVVAVLLLLLAWTAGEAHYSNCVDAAEVRYPAAEADRADRDEALDDCTRWP
jgi:hypothetical protein